VVHSILLSHMPITSLDLTNKHPISMDNSQATDSTLQDQHIHPLVRPTARQTFSLLRRKAIL
jgi:hypothetical protein